MKTLLQSAAVLTLLCLSVGTAVLVYDAHHFAQHVDGIFTKAQGEWQNEKADLHALLAAGKDAAVQADQFATEQRKQFAKTSRDSDNQVRNLALVTRNAEQFFYHLDQQVNGKVLPDFDRELVATSSAAQFSLEAIAHSSDTLTFQLNDPAISQMAEHLNDASFSIATAGANTASATKHLDAATADIEQDVHRLTRPPTMLKQIGMALLDAAAKLGSISAGFVK